MKKILIILATLFEFAFGVKLVVLDPAAVEMLYMLKAEDSIAAIAISSTAKIYPEDKTAKLPNVGSYMKPNLERIVEINPDLVITSFHSINVDNDLKNLGLKTLSLNANSLNDIYKNIEKIADITQKQEEGKKLIDEIKSKLSHQDKLSDKKVVVLFSALNLMAFNDGTLPIDITNNLGLKNIAKNLQGTTSVIQTEYILEQNPDFIIVVETTNNSKSLLQLYPVLSKTKAAKNGKIISVPSAIILRGTPRIAQGIENIYEILTK
ncbi:ABC transporter substrate-binding protein [Campylobacter fetus]|uniref:ABC transporter substrate-binding protein n=1 Tax=Campylobacter fetus TaxID=196 RepID=UPI00138E0C84|nr:ABC transporter substrate-binding protein [Campylobacter fetus]